MPREPTRALSGVNVPGFPMAGFQVTLYGRIWVTPEGLSYSLINTFMAYTNEQVSPTSVMSITKELFDPWVCLKFGE
jgi:hypothetical protein